jgi:hypothetical protein
MSQKVSPGGLFRRLFTCPSNPEVSTISDNSDEAPTQHRTVRFGGEKSSRLRKRRPKDDRFRSASNICQSREFAAAENRLSTSECQLSGFCFYCRIRIKSLEFSYLIQLIPRLWSDESVFWDRILNNYHLRTYLINN